MASVPQMVSACLMSDPGTASAISIMVSLCMVLAVTAQSLTLSLGWGEAAFPDFSCAPLVALLLRESFPPSAAFRWFPRVSVSSGCITSTTDGVGGRGLTDIWFLSDLRAGSVRSSVSRAGPSEASLRGLCMLSSPCVLTRLPSMCACSLVSFYKDTSPTRPIPITSFLSLLPL